MVLQRMGWMLTFVAPMALAAQQVPPGSADLQGRIRVVVYTAPLTGVPLELARSGVTIPFATDAAGTAVLWIVPGSYQLHSREAVTAGGRAYRWDVPVTVAVGMRAVTLTTSDATVVEPAMAPPGANETPRAGQATAADPAPAKDPALATTLSFLLPGTGEFYSGAPGSGAVHLAVDLAATTAVIYGIHCRSQYSCNGDSCAQSICTSGNHGNQWIASGAVVGIANTLFSMWDAHHAATAYNAQRGLVARLERARPLIAVGARGETRLGLTL